MIIRNMLLGLATLLLLTACGTTPSPTTHAHPHPHPHAHDHAHHSHNHTKQDQKSFQIIVRPVGNPLPQPPEKYPDFLAKVGGLQLTYIRTLPNKAYLFRSEKTTLATAKRTAERLSSHPYIRYAEINKRFMTRRY